MQCASGGADLLQEDEAPDAIDEVGYGVASGTCTSSASAGTEVEDGRRKRCSRVRDRRHRHAGWPWRRRKDGRGGDSRAECNDVIGPTGTVKVMVATKPVDFRKGAEGMAALVRETTGADPFSGAVYVVRAKRTDRIKLIFWDGIRTARSTISSRGPISPLPRSRPWPENTAYAKGRDG